MNKPRTDIEYRLEHPDPITDPRLPIQVVYSLTLRGLPGAEAMRIVADAWGAQGRPLADEFKGERLVRRYPPNKDKKRKR